MFKIKSCELEIEELMAQQLIKKAEDNKAEIVNKAIGETKLAAKLLDDIGLKQASNKLLEVIASVK